MSIRSESPHTYLRPAQPLAVGIMLAQVSTATLALTFAALLGTHLVAFDLALMIISGTSLFAMSIRAAERDRIVWDDEQEPSFRSRLTVWAFLIAFAAGPWILAAVLIDRFLGTPIVIACAVGANVAGWSIAALSKLALDPIWLPRPKSEEAEGGAALGAVLLALTLCAGWLLVEIDSAFGHGPLPSGLGERDGIVLSLVATFTAGIMSILALSVRAAGHGHSKVVALAAFAVLLLPILFLLALPMYRFGEPLPSFIPVYASAMPGRVFLSAAFAFGLVELIRSRKAWY